ncbi:hypothetical protein E3N88_32058 [Mikania micrantha]|uniref:CCHC-type domain-containing protein n=1 Tax=Mikania micrantha TaxID=192012 RepID=A0A5N6M7D8_9ASTR|nr:hypothetical protein E3N88_32058 [Mikania micrantha]
MSSASFPIVIYDSDEEYAPITPQASAASIPPPDPPAPIHPVVSDDEEDPEEDPEENPEEDLEEDPDEEPEDKPSVSHTIEVIHETDADDGSGETLPHKVLYGPATSDDTVEASRAVTPLPSPRRRSKSPVDTSDVEPTPKRRKIAARRWDWMSELLQDWRYEEGTPPTYEEGESSRACHPRLITAPSNTAVRALEDRVQILEGQVLTMEEEHYLDDQALHTMHARLSSVEEEISTLCQRLTTMEHRALTAEQQLATSESRAESTTALAIVFMLKKNMPRGRPRRNVHADTETPQQMNSAEIEQLVDQRVANAIADYEANRANGVGGSDTGGGGAGGSHTDGSGPDRGRGGATRVCTYKDFLNCQPLNFKGTEALTWWNSHAQELGIDEAYQISWEDLKKMLLAEYCPRSELQKLEEEFWNLVVIGADIASYTTRFHEMALLCPTMVTPEYKRIERYIGELPSQIESMVTASCPDTIHSAVRLAHRLVDQAVRRGTLVKTETTGNNNNKKRKWDGNPNKISSNQFQKKPPIAKVNTVVSTGKKPYTGNNPKCNKCGYHHIGTCESFVCGKCNKPGHTTKFCRYSGPTTNNQPKQGCYECGNVGHFRKDCPKLRNQGGNNARGRAFVLGAGEARKDPNLVTGTFLVNNHYASILFDTGADKSFVSTDLSSTLGMDWLSKNHAEIVCHEKIVRIPLPSGNTLSIQDEKSGATLQIISCMRARKYLRKGYHAILAHERVVALSDIMTRRIEPEDDTIHFGEETHVQQRENNQYWQWFLDLIRSWVWEERVPPPPTANTANSLWTLPALGYPLEQAFAAFVARMEREIRNMRESQSLSSTRSLSPRISRIKLGSTKRSRKRTGFYQEDQLPSTKCVYVAMMNDMMTCGWHDMCMVLGCYDDMILAYPNASAGQTNGYGALCRHKPTVRMVTVERMMMMMYDKRRHGARA